MEKKNDPKKAFLKTTVEMTGKAEVLVISPCLYARAIQAAIAYNKLYEDELKGWASPVDTLTAEERAKLLGILTCFLSDLLFELGDGVDLHLLPTLPGVFEPSSDANCTEN